MTDTHDLILERNLDAPRDKLWRCWTEPELLQQWFCPKPWYVTDARIDLQPGGEFFTVMNGPDGVSLGDIRVGVNDKLSDIARNVLNAEGPIGVIDPDGTLVGHLTRAKVMDALFPDKEPMAYLVREKRYMN